MKEIEKLSDIRPVLNDPPKLKLHHYFSTERQLMKSKEGATVKKTHRPHGQCRSHARSVKNKPLKSYSDANYQIKDNKVCKYYLVTKSLRPEGAENIPILFQGADLDFSNQNDLRNPKLSSKQSVPDATE